MALSRGNLHRFRHPLTKSEFASAARGAGLHPDPRNQTHGGCYDSQGPSIRKARRFELEVNSYTGKINNKNNGSVMANRRSHEAPRRRQGMGSLFACSTGACRAVLIALMSDQSPPPQIRGYVAAGLVVCGDLGFIGSVHARFADFVAPRAPVLAIGRLAAAPRLSRLILPAAP